LGSLKALESAPIEELAARQRRLSDQEILEYVKEVSATDPDYAKGLYRSWETIAGKEAWIKNFESAFQDYRDNLEAGIPKSRALRDLIETLGNYKGRRYLHTLYRYEVDNAEESLTKSAEHNKTLTEEVKRTRDLYHQLTLFNLRLLYCQRHLMRLLDEHEIDYQLNLGFGDSNFTKFLSDVLTE
jgi:hypothetical protein